LFGQLAHHTVAAHDNGVHVREEHTHLERVEGGEGGEKRKTDKERGEMQKRRGKEDRRRKRGREGGHEY
jgi:hypothetical protein